MKACRYEGCKTPIMHGRLFCVDHRETDYARRFRLLNGMNQP